MVYLNEFTEALNQLSVLQWFGMAFLVSNAALGTFYLFVMPLIVTFQAIVRTIRKPKING